MSSGWKKKLLPWFPKTGHQSQDTSKKEMKKPGPQFKLGDRVCFFLETREGEMCGIGKIVALECSPVMNQSGKVGSFSYVADIESLYETPFSWELHLSGEESSSDDPLPLALPTTAILLAKLDTRMKKQEEFSGSKKIFRSVSGERFSKATYGEFLRAYCRKSTITSSVYI